MLDFVDSFPRRHIGPTTAELEQMLAKVGVKSLDELIEKVVPKSIRAAQALKLPTGKPEFQLLEELEQIAAKNQVFRSLIGLGYHDTITPPVILRNIFQNPGWYTQYTPYQAEIAQGRLEALLNYQTMVTDLTGLPVANASLLDEGTAAAEAMHLMHSVGTDTDGKGFFVSDRCHPQTIEVVKTRAKALSIEVIVGDAAKFDHAQKVFGMLLQYPETDGAVKDPKAIIEKAHQHGCLVVVATDLLACTMLTPPGELGADVAVGSAQRFGVPLGYGGPHAAFFSTRTEYARSLPGRLIGLSVDAQGNPALRMALQTREQHIRREKATSNICTAQVLLAVMAGMYAVYHGPNGLKQIARRVNGLAKALSAGLKKMGFALEHDAFFDTISVKVADPKVADGIEVAARAQKFNLRRIDATHLGVALDETVAVKELSTLFQVFAGGKKVDFEVESLAKDLDTPNLPEALRRTSTFLGHPVFNSHHSEHQMLRYIRGLEARDLSLTHSMIPLGSCTMKLNATSEMIPVTWPGFSRLHPFVPANQAQGYAEIFKSLEGMLTEITGFNACSLMPNAGSQGEYAGLLVIRAYHHARGQTQRDVCLIPQSAHGTNPASAVMAGMRVVVVKTDEKGNIDVADLEKRAEEHKDKLAALMVTYPSTHGVFEEEIRTICQLVHDRGGQVYMDGANLNAQVGLCRPGEFGADVLHINLHKTFCIPHGGGGPGMGPICVAKHLAPHLPTHPLVKVGGEQGVGPVSAAPWGSASILLISWVYIQLMGGDGLTQATKVAILNANYIASQLKEHYPLLYSGKSGLVGHECILDPRKLKTTAGVEVEDIAKRLIDYGFHAPTVSFPVAGTLMVEPTESESKDELDRFCTAMTQIRDEIREVEQGKASKDDNLLKGAPHTGEAIASESWKHPYSRERAAYPTPQVRAHKFWPKVGRVNNVLGDRQLVCTCPPIESYGS